MCECTACVYCSALCRGNPTHPALPARLPTHHCSTRVQVQTPQGKNYSSLRSAPPSHFCRLHQAIYSFRINWKVNEGMCVWRISFPLVPFAVSNQFLLQGNPTFRLQPRFQGWHHVSSYHSYPLESDTFLEISKQAKMIPCHHEVVKDSKQQFPSYPLYF